MFYKIIKIFFWTENISISVTFLNQILNSFACSPLCYTSYYLLLLTEFLSNVCTLNQALCTALPQPTLQSWSHRELWHLFYTDRDTSISRKGLKNEWMNLVPHTLL